MAIGDLFVCGVQEDLVLEDVGINVPRGVAVPISPELVHKSKDLWRCLSQGLIFKCDVSRVVAMNPPKAPPPTLDVRSDTSNALIAKLQGDLVRSNASNALLEGEVGRLQAEVARLQSELVGERSKTQTSDPRLDTIIGILERQLSSPSLRSGLVSLPSETSKKEVSKVDDSAPMYIPSFETPKESVVTPKEAPLDRASLESASQALRSVRKRGGQ